MRFARNNDKPQERPRQSLADRPAASKQVFSYYNTGAKQRSATPENEKPIRIESPSRLRLVPTMIALAIILLSVLVSLTISARPSVSTLNDQPSPYRPLAEYEAAAEELINQSAGNKSKLTVQTHDVERSLMDKFPELNAAVLRLPVLGRRPSLIIDIKPPALLLITSTNNYVLDNAGVIISEYKFLPNEFRDGLLAVKDESGLPAQNGSHVLPTDTIKFIEEIKHQLEAQDLHIASMTLPASANQLDIKLEGQKYFIKTDVAGDPRLQMGSFIAVRDELQGKGITPVEYIDVRVEEKVFYK